MFDAPIDGDLADFLPEGAAIIGHVSAIKYIAESGEIEYLSVAEGISVYEQIGLAHRLKTEAATDIDMAYLDADDE